MSLTKPITRALTRPVAMPLVMAPPAPADGVPDNALTLDGDPIALDGDIITLEEP